MSKSTEFHVQHDCSLTYVVAMEIKRNGFKRHPGSKIERHING